jgi:hypothetical protein
MKTAAAPASLAPPAAMGAAAPVNVAIGAAGVVEAGATEVAHLDDVGATGVGVMIGAGAEEDQSTHWLLTGAGGGGTTLEVQSFHWLVAGTGTTGVELVQSAHAVVGTVGTTGTTGVVQSCQCEEVVGTTGTTGVEVQSSQ